MSQSLLPLRRGALPGEHHTKINIPFLSFVLGYISEDISIFHTFFTRKGKRVRWLWATGSWCNSMARRLLLPLRMSVQVLNWLTLLWNNYAFHSGTFYHAVLPLCRLHVLRRYKREEQRLVYFYTCISPNYIHTHPSNGTFKCKIMWEFTDLFNMHIKYRHPFMHQGGASISWEEHSERGENKLLNYNGTSWNLLSLNSPPSNCKKPNFALSNFWKAKCLQWISVNLTV